MSSDDTVYLRLAAAYVRGSLEPSDSSDPCFTAGLDELSAEQQSRLYRLGLERGLRLHRFKRTMDLSRVRRVLGMLHGIAPINLLDIGSGRGAFLWPLLDAFPHLPVTAVDLLPQRVAAIQAVRDGGVATLTVIQGDITRLDLGERSYDVVTMLEVLEHIPDTYTALARVCSAAGRFLIISVPAHPDDNPEHIHLFSQRQLGAMLVEHGMYRVRFDNVYGHVITIASR